MNSEETTLELVPEGTLVARVAADDDGAAFEELVRRHGPMVLDVCKRSLGDIESAEDAMQATFFVLWKKARSLRKRTCIAGWLHLVARNVCRNAGRSRQLRRLREREAAELKHSRDAAADQPHALLDVLDEELGRLPEKYRVPIILFHLEGRSLEEAASVLDANQSTLATRLSRARKLLCQRLARQGIPCSVAILSATLASHTSQAVSAALVTSTSRAAQMFAASQLTSGAAYGQVALAEGTIRMMTLKTTAAAVAVTAGTLLPVGMIVTWSMLSTVLAADELAQAEEARRLVGTWSVLELHQVNYEPTREEKEHLKNRNFKVRISADTITFLADQSSMKYRLDTTQRPKVIEYVKDGQVTAKAIYELEGDDLKICLGRTPHRGEPQAPTDFDISKRKPGEFPTLFVMSRDQPERENVD